MKKNLFLLGMAVAALASCTNEEVTDVARNRAIRFDQFVNNNTRSVTELTSITNFYVFGKADNANVFDNERNDVVKYWEVNKTYNFAAYADGENGNKLDGATYDLASKSLTIPSYTPNDAKDFIAAVSEEIRTEADLTNQQPVSLTFKHMLSQVKFTFTTDVDESYTIKISGIKFTAVQTAKGTYSASGATWTEGTNGDYAFSEIDDIAVEEGEASCDSKLVIPQGSTDQIKVEFTATMFGAGLEDKVKTFTADLGVAANIAGEASAANTWMPGFRYNYTAEITAEKINSNLKQIVFTPDVDGWENTNPED